MHGGQGGPRPPRMDRAAHPRSLTVVPWQLGPHVHPAHHAWLVGTSWTFTSPPHLEARPILAKPRCTHCPEPRARPGLDLCRHFICRQDGTGAGGPDPRGRDAGGSVSHTADLHRSPHCAWGTQIPRLGLKQPRASKVM